MECNTDQKELNNMKNAEVPQSCYSDVLLLSEIILRPRIFYIVQLLFFALPLTRKYLKENNGIQL